MSSDERNLIPVVVADDIEIHSEVVSMAPYKFADGDRLNFAFFGPKMSHFVDSDGKIAAAKVDIVKLASVTMSKASAQEFHRSLSVLIEREGWAYD
ncbi:hypothetical protein F9U38_12060 [Pectobacterium versatile]|uniref:hypothetical protein n=1 Tax=Pectobacterium versatile TaxID=2488639 RepID=UPI001B39D013|nr:hypothetical protein [Pectobacterium versatile]MBQ4781242.1 hypothetical protein [Pectobacterium versatile]MBQ4785799.1 hypothetical protein [Pectobacterium versatile]